MAAGDAAAAAGLPTVAPTDKPSLDYQYHNETRDLLVALVGGGWASISHISGYSNAGGSYGFAWSRVPGGVLLRGLIEKNTGTIADNVQVGLLPTDARPTATVYVIVPGSGASANRIRITSAGQVYLDEPLAGTAPTWLSFDGILIPR